MPSNVPAPARQRDGGFASPERASAVCQRPSSAAQTNGARFCRCARAFRRKRPVCCGGGLCAAAPDQSPTVLPRRSASVLACNEAGPMCGAFGPGLQCATSFGLMCHGLRPCASNVLGPPAPAPQCATPRVAYAPLPVLICATEITHVTGPSYVARPFPAKRCAVPLKRRRGAPREPE